MLILELRYIFKKRKVKSVTYMGTAHNTYSSIQREPFPENVFFCWFCVIYMLKNRSHQASLNVSASCIQPFILFILEITTNRWRSLVVSYEGAAL